MSKLDEILFEHRWHAIADFHEAKDGGMPEKTKHQQEAREQVVALILELIDDAHATTTTLNTMPLVSSYRAVDDMRKFARQKVEDL